MVDYEPLAAVIDPEAALAPGAPVQFEAMGSNLAAGMRDRAEIDPLADADVVVRGRFVNQRVAVVPMEGNAIAVIPAGSTDHVPAGRPRHPNGRRGGRRPELTVYVSTQMPHLFRRLACALIGLAETAMRVITPHVGGGFGGKAGITAEHAVALAVARRLGRPVKWVETRSENLVALPHGRSQVQYIEMGFTTEGTITGMHARIVGDAGAYGGFGGGLSMGPTRSMAQGVYRIPKIAYDVAVAVTNTTPVGAFRGAGRPEATAFLERIMDLAADQLGIDPVEIRRRNLLTADQFPFTTLMGTTYDVGDYALPSGGGRGASRLRRAPGRPGGPASPGGSLAARRRASARTSRSPPAACPASTARSRSTTTARSPPVPARRRTARVTPRPSPCWWPTSSTSRSSPSATCSPTPRSSPAAVAPAGRDRSSSAERPSTRRPEPWSSAPGGWRPACWRPTRTTSWSATTGGWAWPAYRPARSRGRSWPRRPVGGDGNGDGEGPLAAALDVAQDGPTFPFGAHVAVVEVDVETGQVRLVRHVAVDDCGRIVNPLLVRGQQHGGIAQGVAQALWEQFVYDEDGNPLTSTLAEYAMPSAAELPSFDTMNTETPTPLNALGAKGIGESGTIGSMPAVQNAVVDALSHLGVRHIEMPCTPERVWRAVATARSGGDVIVWRDPPAFFATLPERGAQSVPEAADVDI